MDLIAQSPQQCTVIGLNCTVYAQSCVGNCAEAHVKVTISNSGIQTSTDVQLRVWGSWDQSGQGEDNLRSLLSPGQTGTKRYHLVGISMSIFGVMWGHLL